MIPENLDRVFWNVKYVLDNCGRYLTRKQKMHFHHVLASLLVIREKEGTARESKFFRLCRKCKTEVDLRRMGTYHYVEGEAIHNVCPDLKDKLPNDWKEE